MDDLLLTGDDTETINDIKTSLMSTYKMTDLGQAQNYLGGELKCTDKGTRNDTFKTIKKIQYGEL